MKFVKVGNYYVNMEDVSRIWCVEGGVQIYFSGLVISTVQLFGDDARRFLARLDRESEDLAKTIVFGED